jgi:DNA-directed RNA polymerase subunit F
MIVKSILGEEQLTLAEVRETLEEIKRKRSQEEEELGYELRRAIRHAELFGHGTAEESRKLVMNLLELEKMNRELALKIADIRPKTRDELRAVYAKERFTLAEEELDKILDILQRE